jgi:hypothetical protein
MQVALYNLYFVLDMLDTFECYGTGSTNHANHTVSLRKKELGQVRAILAGDTSDQSNGHFPLLFQNSTTEL